MWVRDLPRNLACLTNAAISIIRCQPEFRWVPEANRHYAGRPQEALLLLLAALLRPPVLALPGMPAALRLHQLPRQRLLPLQRHRDRYPGRRFAELPAGLHIRQSAARTFLVFSVLCKFFCRPPHRPPLSSIHAPLERLLDKFPLGAGGPGPLGVPGPDADSRRIAALGHPLAPRRTHPSVPSRLPSLESEPCNRSVRPHLGRVLPGHDSLLRHRHKIGRM